MHKKPERLVDDTACLKAAKLRLLDLNRGGTEASRSTFLDNFYSLFLINKSCIYPLYRKPIWVFDNSLNVKFSAPMGAIFTTVKFTQMGNMKMARTEDTYKQAVFKFHIGPR